MCIRYIYHNIYSDGERDVTERTDTCHSGYICTSPEIREFDCRIKCTRLQLSASPGRGGSPFAVKDRQPTPYYSEQYLSPPAPRETERERRHKRRASQVVYSDENTAGYGRSKRDSYAPSSAPIPIPKVRRSSTMPTGDRDYYAQKRDSRSRPVIVDSGDRRRHQSAAVPVGPVDILSGYGDSHRKRRDSYLEPPRTHRRSSRSPEVYATDGEYEREERRRRRRSSKAVVAPEISSGVYADAVYGSSPIVDSYPSSYGSGSGHTAYTPLPVVVNNISSSPSGRGRGSKVRFEDEFRAQQNARISTRPKLSRSATITGAGTGSGAYPQGILKNPVTVNKSSTTSPTVQPVRRDDIPDELYTSLRGLGINERETAAQRAIRAERDQEKEYHERLRNRFSMPPRRFTVEKGSRSGRRTEVFYPEEGTYRSSWV